MRARSVKPSLFKNELLGAADPLYTVVFEGLWCIADRQGRLEDRPLRIHVEVNPYRDSASTVQALDWLVLHGFVVRYEADGNKFLAIVNFLKHQQPHVKEAASKIPAPSNQEVVVAPDKPGANTSVAALTPSSLTPHSLTADSGLLTAGNANTSSDVPRESLSGDFGDFLMTEYPPCTGRRSMTTALHNCAVLVETGKVSEAVLRQRIAGYRAFAAGGGVSDQRYVLTPQNWTDPRAEDPSWAKEWAAPKSKAQVAQDANVAASNEWLERSNAAAG